MTNSAWRMNYELLWEDTSPDAVQWIQDEFDALSGSPAAVPLADFVIEDMARLSQRRVMRKVSDWVREDEIPEPLSRSER